MKALDVKRAVAIGIVALAVATDVRPAPITMEVDGVLDSSINFGGGLSEYLTLDTTPSRLPGAGDPFTYRFTYDPALATDTNPNSNVGGYSNVITAGSVSIGSKTYTFPDSPTSSSFDITGGAGVASSLSLVFSTDRTIENFGVQRISAFLPLNFGPLGYFPDTSLPTVAPDAAALSSSLFDFSVTLFRSGGSFPDVIRGHVTNISLVTPQPPPALQVVLASSVQVAQAPTNGGPTNFSANWKSNLQDAVRGQFEVYKNGTITTLTDSSQLQQSGGPTYIIVHGWTGLFSNPSFGSTLPTQQWVKDMAAALEQKTPGAKVLLYDWSKFASSVPVNQQGVSNSDWFVPNDRVPYEAASLASQLTVIANALNASGSALGDVQILGHSLGAGVAARATEALQGSAVNVTRLTLFDPPENAVGALVSGRVNLAPVISTILTRPGAPVIENYIANGASITGVLDPYGYGLPYRQIANTALNNTSHAGIPTILPQSPMSWYQGTVESWSQGTVDGAGIRGINESRVDLQTRADQVWQNNITAPVVGNYTLSKVADLSSFSSFVKSFFVDKVVDLTTLTVESIRGLIKVDLDISTGIQEVGLALGVAASELFDKTKQVVSSAGNAIVGAVENGVRKRWDSFVKGKDSAIQDRTSIAVGPGWVANGAANFEQGRGLVNTSNSPSYAFTSLHIPSYVDTVYFEFHPEIWGPGDYYVIGFNDELIYYLASDLFSDSIMNTGFLDIARWAGQDVTLTIGLISDIAGHSIATRDYMFLSSSEAPNGQAPEPSTLFLIGVAVGLMAWRKRCGSRVTGHRSHLIQA